VDKITIKLTLLAYMYSLLSSSLYLLA